MIDLDPILRVLTFAVVIACAVTAGFVVGTTRSPDAETRALLHECGVVLGQAHASLVAAHEREQAFAAWYVGAPVTYRYWQDWTREGAPSPPYALTVDGREYLVAAGRGILMVVEGPSNGRKPFPLSAPKAGDVLTRPATRSTTVSVSALRKFCGAPVMRSLQNREIRWGRLYGIVVNRNLIACALRGFRDRTVALEAVPFAVYTAVGLVDEEGVRLRGNGWYVVVAPCLELNCPADAPRLLDEVPA